MIDGAIATDDTSTLARDAAESHDVRSDAAGEAVLGISPLKGLRAVRATHTSGGTAEPLPRDVRDALVCLVGLRCQGINNATVDEGKDAGALETVTSGSCTSGVSVKWMTPRRRCRSRRARRCGILMALF